MIKKAVIEFKNIYFSYLNNDNYNLKNLSFKIYENEYICVIGHNGSGKSTISKILSGLLKPQRGSILINEIEMNYKNVSDLKKNIGIIFQNPDNQFVGITAEDDIAFGLENYLVKHENMQEIIDSSSKIINITSILKNEVHTLSGGQKQKVAITSILALLPSIIIFDESTSMLDSKAKLELKKLMKFLQKDLNKTIISITHDMEELRYADRILFMSSGELLKFDKPINLLYDKKFMNENSLDIPYDLKLLNLISERGVKISPTLDHKKVIDQVAKWK